MNSRATAWSVTMNMKNIPKARCEEYIGRARQNNWNVEGQIEEGQEGTQHYQLLVRTPQVRFSALKKMFPTAHIEVCRNISALKQYVHKEDTRVEEIKSVENKFITWKDVRTKFFQWIDEYGELECDNPDRRLHLFDEFINFSIAEGIECDVIGINPQYRGIIVRYWTGLVRRQIIDRQTRQTDTQEVSVPVYTQQQDDENSSMEEEGTGS